MKSKKITKTTKDSFNSGTNYQCYKLLGSHIKKINGVQGVKFSLWAPNAVRVNIKGDFNGWNGENHAMKLNKKTGIWQLFIPEAKEEQGYLYEVYTEENSCPVEKADPFAFFSRVRPDKASSIYRVAGYNWKDKNWMDKRKNKNPYSSPMNIYEVHLGSWKTHEDGTFYSYRELAHELPEYASKMGYTHIEFLPIMEHPLDDSWGYQITGYYAVTSRYGTPKDFMYLVEKCHEMGLGVILDWVPGHFCKDDHGLYNFDGTHLFEHKDPLRGENYDWGTANFNFEKPQVISFLISNALFWFKYYHIDGIRVDAVANMLYLNYGMKWNSNVKNKFGGNENLDAVDFIKKLNEAIFKNVDNPLVIAEESSTWPMITAPTYLGGLGFNYKWNMGWMNDMLRYMEMDPIYRKWHHNNVTFSIVYSFSENFVLPLSHDEVVHGKKSLLNKMPGDYWQKFANLRLLYGYMIGHPGKKLLFMGGEFGQFIEWNFKKQLDWVLLLYPQHKMLQQYIIDLNNFYKNEVSLWELDHTYEGFSWIDNQNYEQSIVTFMRKSKNKRNYLIFICNFTPVVHYDYKLGVPENISYREVFNSDSEKYGGSGQVNKEILTSYNEKWNNQPYHVMTKVPPLAVAVIKPYYKLVKNTKYKAQIINNK